MTNSIGIDFVLIPAGSFAMGSDTNDPRATSNEMPVHRLTISRSFWLGRYEVTQAQWEAVMGNRPYNEKDRSNAFYNLPGMAVRIRKPDHPVTASWMDVQEFIRRLDAREGGMSYRLPTEAEWEYAARAGTTTAYSFGEDEQQLARLREGVAGGSNFPAVFGAVHPWQ